MSNPNPFFCSTVSEQSLISPSEIFVSSINKNDGFCDISLFSLLLAGSVVAAVLYNRGIYLCCTYFRPYAYMYVRRQPGTFVYVLHYQTCLCIVCTMISCMHVHIQVRARMCHAMVFCLCIKTSLCTYNLRENSSIKINCYAIMHKNTSNKCPLVELSLSAKQIELDSTNISPGLIRWTNMHDT